MIENELEEFSSKCGLSSQEYLQLLKSIKLKNSVGYLSVDNMDIDAEVKTTTSGVKLLTGIP